MSSLRRLLQTTALTACVLIGCSKEKPAETDDWSLDPNALRAETQAGGIATSYTASFDGAHVARISEVRQPQGEKGDYEFKGARLIHYKGAALLGDQDIELTFDMQGALTSTGGADENEVSAIRNRASLLRNLVLAKRTTQSHDG